MHSSLALNVILALKSVWPDRKWSKHFSLYDKTFCFASVCNLLHLSAWHAGLSESMLCRFFVSDTQAFLAHTLNEGHPPTSRDPLNYWLLRSTPSSLFNMGIYLETWGSGMSGHSFFMQNLLKCYLEETLLRDICADLIKKLLKKIKNLMLIVMLWIIML